MRTKFERMEISDVSSTGTVFESDIPIEKLAEQQLANGYVDLHQLSLLTRDDFGKICTLYQNYASNNIEELTIDGNILDLLTHNDLLKIINVLEQKGGLKSFILNNFIDLSDVKIQERIKLNKLHSLVIRNCSSNVNDIHQIILDLTTNKTVKNLVFDSLSLTNNNNQAFTNNFFNNENFPLLISVCKQLKLEKFNIQQKFNLFLDNENVQLLVDIIKGGYLKELTIGNIIIDNQGVEIISKAVASSSKFKKLNIFSESEFEALLPIINPAGEFESKQFKSDCLDLVKNNQALAKKIAGMNLEQIMLHTELKQILNSKDIMNEMQKIIRVMLTPQETVSQAKATKNEQQMEL